MVGWDWFEEDPEDDLSDPQRVFLAVLRVRARSWGCTPDHTQLVEPGRPGDEWCALMDVSTKAGASVGNGLILVAIAVAFAGTGPLAHRDRTGPAPPLRRLPGADRPERRHSCSERRDQRRPVQVNEDVVVIGVCLSTVRRSRSQLTLVVTAEQTPRRTTWATYRSQRPTTDHSHRDAARANMRASGFPPVRGTLATCR
jgi:hypothetical protein